MRGAGRSKCVIPGSIKDEGLYLVISAILDLSLRLTLSVYTVQRVLAHSKASVSANVARVDFTGISSFLHSQPTQKSSKCQIPNISDDIIEKLVLPIVLNDHIN
ncbi:hypothetical protein E3Q06_00922 [Wallemia mellicola]|nr:hypothetical protein E3Q24_02863 [Wallemia mellicola]TIB88711.1 hypothetical protein E3Q21_00895 [Wallemia mellicola]TIB91324.1 hypothetical protein E3Q20_00881 [Wallemia mellicola]TIC25876.1 hypothetical protein E3Q12_00681 [Wallemia mellicola]TIC36880.1 hypothetical protein E3Q09_01171 [Wallemia mellicola]